jgi:hypothetical protein
LPIVLNTIGDVGQLVLKLAKEMQDMHTWREAGRELLAAAKSGDATQATVALELVLMINGALARWKRTPALGKIARVPSGLSSKERDGELSEVAKRTLAGFWPEIDHT